MKLKSILINKSSFVKYQYVYRKLYMPRNVNNTIRNIVLSIIFHPILDIGCVFFNVASSKTRSHLVFLPADEILFSIIL